MRKIFKPLLTIALCVALAAPLSEAQNRGRNHGGGSQQSSQSAPSRSQNNNRPGNSGGGNFNPGNNNRPGNSGNGNFNPGNNNRPGNSGNGNFNPGNNRPGNNGNGNFNPGNNRPGMNNGYKPNPAPGHNAVRPWQGYRPGPVAGFGHIHFGTPSRPMLPPVQPYRRPTPPRYYVPYGGSLFSTILGVTLGTALNISLNALVNSGYAVSAYNDNAVYLNSVRQLNMIWPNATLFYNNGYLSASEFIYSTPYYDINRYNTAYRMLVNNYGMPVSSGPYSDGMQASWWGNNGQYVTLRYLPEIASDGMLRYYTTLSFGL